MMRIFLCSLNFCIVIHWSLVKYLGKVISLKIILRIYSLLNLTESECKSLKQLIQHKDLVSQKAGKGNTRKLLLNCENYLKGMKPFVSDNSKFIPFIIDKRKLLNCIFNLKKELKEHFKTNENNNKISEDEFSNICPIGTGPGILYRLPKVDKIVIANIPKL